MIYLILIILVIIVSYMLLFGNELKLGHIPGPRGIPFFGNSLQLNPRAPRLTFMKWFQEYGACYKVRLLTGNLVVLSDFNTIYEVLVTKGKQFSDRPSGFRVAYVAENTFSLGPADARWKALRMASQAHIKSFGDRIASLETDVTHEMIDIFRIHAGEPFDPFESIRKTALNSIIIFIMGEKLSFDDPLGAKLTKYAADIPVLLSRVGPSFLLVDMLPFFIHFPLQSSKMMKTFKQTELKIWEEIKHRQASSNNSLTKLFLGQVNYVGSGKASRLKGITEVEARITALHMVAGGVNTTSCSLYGLVNVLAHRQDIQGKVHTEIQAVMPNEDNKPTWNLKASLPYVRATLLETIRLFTVVPGGSLHEACEDTELTGYGTIPKGTAVMTNLWALHHNEPFWGDPEVFRPERFLDEDGECVLSDHPNRKHLMPFGAGTRVCPGENFAQIRLFLWTVALVHQFKVHPAEGNDPSWLSPDVHGDHFTLRPAPYQVKFEKRF